MKIYILSNENFDYWDQNYITIISDMGCITVLYESVMLDIILTPTTEAFEQFFEDVDSIGYAKHGRIEDGKFIFNDLENTIILYQTTDLTEFIQYCTETITVEGI